MGNQEIREAGLKVTLPRLKILKILEDSKLQHLRAEDIFQQLHESGDDVGLATVYRVLTQFVEAGLVKRHNFDAEHSVFELDQGDHHDHLVCIKCAGVQEFVDDEIEKRQVLIAKRAKFKMTDHNLTIYGICEHCGD